LPNSGTDLLQADLIEKSSRAFAPIRDKTSPGSKRAGHSNHLFSVYGISLRSEIELSLPERGDPGLAEIEIRGASHSVFADAIHGAELQTRSDWYHYAHLEDGSSYVRWSGLGEFLVSCNGGRITCRRATQASMESFQVYLLGQALSFGLVKRGFEPLHATALAIDGEALVLLGDSGFGKSSLAACFLAAGHRLLTDDLLLLQPSGNGFDGYPGPPRIKLFPGIARRYLGSAADGVPMNSESRKLVVPLHQHQSSQQALPVRAVYALAPPRESRQARHIRIEPLSRREAFVVLLSNTFNYLIVDAHRLQRQMTQSTRLLNAITVKKLTYPRSLNQLPSVRQAILSDLSSSAGMGMERV
jgi:hypothetical protein